MKLKRSLQQKLMQQQAAKMKNTTALTKWIGPPQRKQYAGGVLTRQVHAAVPKKNKQHKQHQDLVNEVVRKRALAQIAVFQLFSNAKLSLHAAVRMAERDISTLEMLLGLVTVIAIKDRKGNEIIATTYKKTLEARHDLVGCILSAVLFVEYLLISIVAATLLG